MKILIVNKADLSIASKYDAAEPNQSNYGGPWCDSNVCAHIAIPEEMDADCVAVEMQEDEMVVVIDAAKASAKLSKVRKDKLKELRKQREPKLAKVDQLVNIAVLDAWTAPEKAELKAYRLALLNMTEVYKADMSLIDALDVSAIEFPIEPSAE